MGSNTDVRVVSERRRKNFEIVAAANAATPGLIEVIPSNGAETKHYSKALATARRERQAPPPAAPAVRTSFARPRERRERRHVSRSTSSSDSGDDADADGPGEAGLAADLLEVVREARNHVATGRALLRPGSLAAPTLERALELLDRLIDDLEDLVDLALRETGR